MTHRVQDTVLGAVLLVIAGTWTWLVIDTISPGLGEGDIGPRAFPLVFGIALLVLAVLLLAWPIFTRSRDQSIAGSAPESSTETSPETTGDELPEKPALHWLPALIVLVEISLYGFLLEKIGFVLATPIVVLIVMIVSLRIYSFRTLVSMALGLTVGCWLVFEKIMGIYLAKGTWFNIG